jgi:hypothetical protein
VLGHRLGRNRDQACRGQNQEKPCADEPKRGPEPERDQREGREGHDNQGVGRHLGDPIGEEGPVVKHERMGPNGKPQVPCNRFELREPVGSGGDGACKASRAAAAPARARRQDAERYPGGGEPQIQPPALLPGLHHASGSERTVVEQHQERRRHHDLLGCHAQQAGRDRANLPAKRPRRLDRPDEAIERQQIEQSHQRLNPLDDVGHGLGLQRMERPQQCGRQRQGRCITPKTSDKGGTRQRPADDPEHRQTSEDMNKQVGRMIAPDIGPAQRIVDRKGDIGDRPAGHGCPGRR